MTPTKEEYGANRDGHFFEDVFSFNQEEMKLESSPRKLSEVTCFCNTIKPISTVCQILGIFPITMHHFVPRPSSPPLPQKSSQIGPTKLCELHEGNRSCPSIISLLLTINFLYFVYWTQFNMIEMLSVIFKGTDLYALYLEVISKYFQVFVLLIFSRWKRSHFCTAWRTIHQVSRDLQQQPDMVSYQHRHDPKIKSSLCILKQYSYLILTVIGLVSLPYIIFFSVVIVFPCLSGDTVLTKCNFFSSILFQKLTHTYIVLYAQTFAALFLIMSLILRALHLEICKKLQSTLQAMEMGTAPNVSVIKGIEDLRMLHESLCVATDQLSNYFGIPSMVCAVCAVFSITCGIYTTILSQVTKVNGIPYIYYFIWCFHMFFGMLSLLILLVAGQIVKNAGVSARKILYGARYGVHLNTDAKLQVSIFLQKLTHPNSVAAFGITEISMGFLASASANIVTYLLVLLQFRLAVDGLATNTSAIS